MQIINIKDGFESGLYEGVIAIGNFDGLHKGHQQIIRQVIAKANELKKPAGVLTFNPSPIEFFLGEKNFHLTNFEQKTYLLEEMGIDYTAYARFTEDFSLISAKDFVKHILVEKMKVSHVFTGVDFHFGNKAKGQGNSELLQELGKKYGFGYSAVEKILDEEGHRYSSTRARVAISNGDVEKAAGIMGRDFSISGMVKKGSAKGGEVLGTPTANIGLDGYVLPKYGVYCCEVIVSGKKYKAIANIGVRPTFDNDTLPQLEAHIFDFNEDIYGKMISVVLNSFIREERKFNGIDELKEQIRKDIISCKTK